MVVTLTATEDGRKLTNFLQLMKTKEYNIFVSYFTSCQARLKNCEKRLLSFVMSQSNRTELGTQQTDFHEILYLSIFRKSVEKVQV